MVQHVHGVVGISNNIIVTPKVSPGQVQAKIEEAFKREAEIDARHISVAISDHTARLYGHVHSLNEATPQGQRPRQRQAVPAWRVIWSSHRDPGDVGMGIVRGWTSVFASLPTSSNRCG